MGKMGETGITSYYAPGEKERIL